MVTTCEFYYIRRRDNLPVQTKGIETTWPELQKEFHHKYVGYPGAIYYKTISAEGPEMFAVVNRKWVLYCDKGKWHRYVTACDIKIETICETKRTNDEHEEDSWIIISDREYDIQPIDN